MPDWMIYLNIVASIAWAFQIIFAFLNHRRNKKLSSFSIKHTPRISVIIPAYNEEDKIVQKSIDSVISQQNVELEVFVIDDGSETPLKIQAHPKVKLIRLNENTGKRYAQIEAVRKSKFGWIATIDSDTFIEPGALYELYRSALAQKADAVTGNVLIQNEKENLLTRMVACLYWYGFEQERASQAYFGQVTCCSGALALFRKSQVLESADMYLNQTFLGKKCITGDDRYLTCLFALKRKKIGYAPGAVAYTVSPPSLMEFTQQQLRWSRSNTPAMLFVAKNMRRISVSFMAFMWLVMFRYGYFGVLHISIWTSIFLHKAVFVIPMILIAVLVVGIVKGMVAFAYTRNPKFLLMVPLSVFTLTILSPVVVFGSITPTHTGWLTRKKGVGPKKSTIQSHLSYGSQKKVR